ncbi:aldose-1-epimerase [Ornithinimicrobium pratense]|uniref:Aldose-1-epimerase n=1 Tax=Ornithinimicrobium pratense TaxID=2593973 RepID=A0A5J6V3D7_9MICO|nr:aldose-1-epimerase [Ornithinimicrobium pratense]QFG68450.1 aldose-1-epimerase [Ornithinimicrobium pratense]
MTVHGTVLTLQTGDYSAQVGQVGATLLSLTHRGHHLVDPVAADQLDDAWRGRTLVPWPNRVVGGRYAVEGTSYELPVNEHETGAALHGLAAFQRWDLVEHTTTSVTWALELPPSYGYPFQVRCQTTYTLGEDGLGLSIEGTNIGSAAAPFGAATHPYLTCAGRSVDECRLSLPAGAVLLADDNSSPTELMPVADADLDLSGDLSGPIPLAGLEVDHAFTDLPATWAVELTHPDAPGVRVDSDAPWVQLYTGDRIGRVAAAVEPMTCPPDAYNREPDAVLLLPGETRTLSLRISALAPQS